MNDLHEHYRQLIGLDPAWAVESVELSLEEKRVVVELRHASEGLVCPECGQSCPLADHAPERRWRHLDTMQFETQLVARLPRTKCEKCGVKTVTPAWAGKHSRFTLMFEAFAIQVLQACNNVKRAAELLRLDWGAVDTIMKRAVKRGLQRRSVDSVKRVGIDEKSFRKGHRYVSVMTDIEGGRVLEVSEGRDEKAASQLWKSLPESQRERIEAAAIDMWPAFASSVKAHAPQAEIVHDKFHVSKHLNDAVDQVRRHEHKQLLAAHDERLKKTKQLWLWNESNLPDQHRESFASLKEMDLKTSRAWAMKETFRGFWTYSSAGHARRFFSKWYDWAIRSRLDPMKKKAKMLKRHLSGLLSYFRHAITNAKSEAFNSTAQFLKAAARGLHRFDSFRTRILFYCGGLDLLPAELSH